MNVAPLLSSSTVTDANTLPRLIDQLAENESREQPDVVVPLSKVRLTVEGHVSVPYLYGQLRLTGLAKGQLARMLGVRWETWFHGASPRERAQEANGRLARVPRDVRVRVRSFKRADGADADGCVRAFVSPMYSAISDVALGKAIRDALVGVEPDARLIRADVTDLTTSYIIKLGEPFEVGDGGEVGEVFGGLAVRNSGVGFTRLNVSLSLTRVACSNGLCLPGPSGALVRAAHRGINLALVREKVVAGLDGVNTKLHRGAQVLEDSTRHHIDDAEREVRGLLRRARLPLGLLSDVMGAYAREPRQSRFAVAQALTLAAQRVTPEVRYDLEALAGRYIARAS